MNHLQFVVPLIIGCIALGAVTIGAFALIGQVRANATKNWSEAAGRILSSEVVQRTYPGRNQPRLRYFASLSYEYSAEGQTFKGENITRGQAVGYRTKDRLEDELRNYPVGSLITVYYNPVNPAEAVLSHRTPQNVRILWMVFVAELVSLPIIYFVLNNFLPTFTEAVAP